MKHKGFFGPLHLFGKAMRATLFVAPSRYKSVQQTLQTADNISATDMTIGTTNKKYVNGRHVVDSQMQEQLVTTVPTIYPQKLAKSNVHAIL